MCIASYWLSDISWVLSGYAIRRAGELNLDAAFKSVIAENNAEAVDCVRLWYSMFVCDEHLCILYSRPAMISCDNAAIRGWEDFLRSPATNESDRRLVSQVALLVIMSNVRDLFGLDYTQPIPRAFTSQITSFSRQLDSWINTWSLGPNEFIGDFPAKGALLHYHFAKLQLYSHCFRGLTDNVIPSHLRDGALAAVGAASTIVELLVSDVDLAAGLRGIPSYLHSMIAFACVFLLKIATKFGNEYCHTSYVIDLTAKFIQQLNMTPVGRWHLAKLMIPGLEKMVHMLVAHTPKSTDLTLQDHAAFGNSDPTQLNGQQQNMFPQLQMNNFMDMSTSIGNPFLQFDSANLGLDYSAFGLS